MSFPSTVLRCLLMVICVSSVCAFGQKAIPDTTKSNGDKIRILCVNPVSDTILKAKQTIVLHKSGFPLQIRDQRGDSLFTEPIHLHVVSGATHKDIRFTSNEIIYTQWNKRKISWESTSSSPALSMKVSGTLEKQKQLSLTVTFTALEDIQLDDIKLHLPYSIQWADMLEGLGRKYGAQTDTLRWQWQDHPDTKEATLWQGNSTAGLKLQLPELWKQTDKAGFWIGIKGKSMLLEHNSGAQPINAGETRTYHLKIVPTTGNKR
ncbi:glycoside hydrolase domain-containing protein [Filimonas effusa]|uniref:Glycoside hydrolase 123-like N-terminal domain-containing protein n=1 Tax=Filimonas effusa TaxID=2508721 RepID=A0A4Q1D999_9BACT|nr:glycoside hydrolase domain-containing protein [Filimonas effusa]RXK85947.1 hypothetical protein ESB13_03810 [Filimonas effusa]